MEPDAETLIEPLLEEQEVTLEGVAVTLMAGVEEPIVAVAVPVQPFASLAVMV